MRGAVVGEPWWAWEEAGQLGCSLTPPRVQGLMCGQEATIGGPQESGVQGVMWARCQRAGRWRLLRTPSARLVSVAPC